MVRDEAATAAPASASAATDKSVVNRACEIAPKGSGERIINLPRSALDMVTTSSLSSEYP
jgi:hypothetical protein